MQVSKIRQPLSITIFTDGSCHTQLKTGGWAAIIFIGADKIILNGSDPNTTHQRMELTAVLESLTYLQHCDLGRRQITIYSDSQYVVDMLDRKERLISSDYKTKKLKPIRNSDLVQALIRFMESFDIQFQKIKSHQRRPHNAEALVNREVDLLSRQKMREHPKQ